MKKSTKLSNKQIIAQTIGREHAEEHTKRNVPVFEEDLKTTWTKGIPFMHTVKKCGSKLFSI